RDGVARDAAIARLIVIGPRAVERLLATAQSDGTATMRIAAWRALDAIGDARALEPALNALGDRDQTVAAAAATVARRFVRSAQGASVVDRLTAGVLDRRKPDIVRVAALRALGDLEPTTTAPLLQSLADDPSDAVRAESRSMRERVTRRKKREKPARPDRGAI